MPPSNTHNSKLFTWTPIMNNPLSNWNQTSHYLILLRILVDGYTKEVPVVIAADNEYAAKRGAIYNECHTDCPITPEATANDAGMLYSVRSIVKITEKQAAAAQAYIRGKVPETQGELSDDASAKLDRLGLLDAVVRNSNVGASNYADKVIQPWSIWLDYPELTCWDHDIVKRVLRTKEGADRIEEYEKIKHICDERIRQLNLSS